MRERGGPTVQSGILYQNSVTSLYLGRLCDATPRPDPELVLSVRVEAPDHVDDTVVTFADNHRAYIQAKENVRQGQSAWEKLWRDFDEQFHCHDFQRDRDRLLLHVGEIHDEHHDLQGLCERASNSRDHHEWWQRLTRSQKALVERIRPLIRPESPTDTNLDATLDTNLLTFFGHIDVEIWSLRQIERDLVPYWMPQSNEPPNKLFRLLRDRVGGEARHRGIFTADDLRKPLEAEGVCFVTPLDIGDLRDSVRECGALLRQHKYTIANTGIHLRRSIVDDIVEWAQESTSEDRVALLLDQAGMGKTVVLRDVLCALDDLDLPVLAIKADQQVSEVEEFAELQQELRLPDSVERIVGRLTSLGPVIVLIDQIDALSLSLARNQRALDIVLQLVASLRLIPEVRILLSCRTFDWSSDPRLTRIETSRKFALAEFSEKDVEDVLRAVNADFKELSGSTQKLLRIPLHLDVFVRALEDQAPRLGSPSGMQDVASIQELYHHLWRNVVLKPAPDGPPSSDREDVLRRITQYMDSRQQTSAPQSLFSSPETKHLERAVTWLASEGILMPRATEWTLMHQTFFDYCYARQFVESGSSLADTILASEQGLFQRPQLVHVLSYLRTTNPSEYLRELQRLFTAGGLRFHLQDLLFRWFGSLQDPSDGEWLITRRLLLDSAVRPRLLRALHGNPGWFSRLNGKPIHDLLAQDDQTLDTQIIPYLGSMLDLEPTQAEVVTLVMPYLGRSEQWTSRIVWMLSYIRNWHSDKAVDLFEQTFCQMLEFDLGRFFHLGDLAKSYPQAGCRLIRLVLDRSLESYMSKQVTEHEGYTHSLYNELDSLDRSGLDEVLKLASEGAPPSYIENILPWVEQVVQLRNEPVDDLPFFVSDDLCYGWYHDLSRTRGRLIETLILALSSLARSEPEGFRKVAARLATLPYRTPQQLLAHVYRTAPEVYAEDAFRFLIADQRRLNLGDRQQYDSRQLIKAIYPFLSENQRAELEALILAYAPIWKHLGVDGLRRRGLEQLYLLQSIPIEYLTEHGHTRLMELERKFPGMRASETPVTLKGGVVGSPIPLDAARRMSDVAWLRAMQKYQGGVEHKESLKGGARELATVLSELVKEDPERFYHLVQRVPDSVDERYVPAFLNGLAESEAPATWLFDVVRRFASLPGRDIRRTIAWSLEKRARNRLPDDLMDLLEGYIQSPMGEDEIWWEQSGSDLINGHINSERGSSFETLMRALSYQNTEAARSRQWQLIEFVAADPSPVLRVGAIHHLTYLLGDSRERAISIFERLMDGCPVLLRSHHTQEFVYYGFYKHYPRMRPFIRDLMDYDDEQCQQRGAELACIAAISPLALDSPEERADVQELTKEIISGPATWRRGAARAYAHNMAEGPSVICEKQIGKLVNDEDTAVQQHVSEAFHYLKDDHFFSLRGFIEQYAASRSLHTGMHEFTEYLWEYGILDPPWTLSLIEVMLENEPLTEEVRWHQGGEKLIRLALRVYNDPIADIAMRTRAMDVFDRLMERYAGEAQKVLSEWDRR